MAKIQIIARVLIIYLIALLVMPCHDGCDIGKHEITSAVASAQDHHEMDGDICSPFCSCACCATAIQGLQFVQLTVPPHFSVRDFNLLNPVFYSQENTSIWQPPKLV